MWVWKGLITNLNLVISLGLTENVTFEQRLEGGKKVIHVNILDKRKQPVESPQVGTYLE